MLNRRHLRIRVLQFVYSWSNSKDTDIVILEKQFLKSLNKVQELYTLLFLLIVELRDFAENYKEEAKNKKLPTNDDLNPNTKFIDNVFIKKLKEDSDLMKHSNTFKISFADQYPMIKGLYFSLIGTELYQDYMQSIDHDFDTDKKFVIKLFSKFLIDSDPLQDFLTESDIFWDDDLPFISSMIVKTIKESSQENISFYQLFKDKVERDFALNLLRFTVIYSDEYSKLISSKTQNWELDRVAQMDLILMQMALAELLKMPQIPVKVTINEYLELAKYYSTPNSKNFVNGILDSLLIDLKKEGAIRKIGRGLIE
jgi:N utilization substance protein B